MKSFGEDLKFFILVFVFAAIIGGGLTLGALVVQVFWILATEGMGGGG